MNYLKFITSLLVLFSASLLTGQDTDYDIRYFTTEDGLSHPEIRSVFQGSDGFIWGASKIGLNRFDGNEFKVFTKRKNGLVNNEISKVIEDAQGKLWVLYSQVIFGINYTISIFDKNKNQAISFDKAFPSAPFRQNEIAYISDVSKNKIWIITKAGAIYSYQDKFQLISKNPNLSDIRKLIATEEKIWIACNEYTLALDMKGRELKKYTHKEAKVYDFGFIARNPYWLSNQYDKTKVSFFVKDLKSDSVIFEFKNLSEDPKELIRYLYNEPYVADIKGVKQIWLGGINSLKVLNIKGEEIFDFTSIIHSRFPNFVIDDIYKDRFDNFWISTNRGLVLFSPKIKLFDSFLKHSNKEEFNSMRGIEDFDETHLFVSSYKGFYLVNKLNNKVLKLDTENQTKFGLGTLTVGDTILSGIHSSIFWIFNKQSRKFKINELDNLEENGILFFHKDRLGKIWIIVDKGLYYLNKKMNKVIQPIQLKTENDLDQRKVNHILEDEKGLWLSTDHGLYLIDLEGRVKKYFEELKGFQISFFHHRKNDEYWLATKANGLIKWNKKNRSIQQFTTENGLSHDFIYNILEDYFGYLWLASNDGLMRFNLDNYSINTFTESDGIAHHEFNSLSYLKSQNGKIYFGGLNGITAFDPKNFLEMDRQNFPLEVISFKKLSNQEEGFKDLTEEYKKSKSISFSDSDKAFSMQFSLFDFKNSFQSKYAYQIKGYDKNWSYLNNNELKMNRLPYGKYILKVKAQGSSGYWSEKTLAIPLHFFKPFYLKWQFILLSLLAFAAVIYGAFRLRIIHLKKRNLILENVVADRTKQLVKANDVKDQFFAIIAHDMRGLVLSFKNTSQKVGFLQRKGRGEEVDSLLQSIDKSAESLSNLLDNLLHWALVEKGVFPHHPEMLNLENLVLENMKLFTQISRIKNVKLSYEGTENLNLFADKNAVSAIIRNLINNAIKFSKAGDEVTIETIQEPQKIKIKISDTGIGIASGRLKNIFELNSVKNNQGTIGEKGTGLGLLLCKELIDMNKGKIRIESQEGIGTNVLIEFPLMA